MTTKRNEYEVLFGLLVGKTAEQQQVVLTDILENGSHWGKLTRLESKVRLFNTPHSETYVRSELNALKQYHQAVKSTFGLSRVLEAIADPSSRQKLESQLEPSYPNQSMKVASGT